MPALVCALAGLAACSRLGNADRHRVEVWLGCSECDGGELDSVVARASLAWERRPLVSALATAAYRAPDDVATAGLRRALSIRFVADSALVLSLTGSPPAGWPPRSEWVQRQVENRVAVRQVRAAIALRSIGGPDALLALDSLAALRPRSDVAVLVDSLRSEIRGP